MRRMTALAFVFMLVAMTGCSILPPQRPDEPRGPSSGVVGIAYTFGARTEDPNGDPICYRFDWGNGDMSDWSQWVPSGMHVTMMKRWS